MEDTRMSDKAWEGDIQMKTLEFKSISPFFEQERDGDKPFTFRKLDLDDSRFKALFEYSSDITRPWHWAIKITNPATSDSFTRCFRGWTPVAFRGTPACPVWLILFLGVRIENV